MCGWNFETQSYCGLRCATSLLVSARSSSLCLHAGGAKTPWCHVWSFVLVEAMLYNTHFSFLLLLSYVLFTWGRHCASVGVCTCYSMYVEARAQSCGAWLVPLLCESPRDRSQVDGQPWWKVPLPVEPSHWSFSFCVSLHCLLQIELYTCILMAVALFSGYKYLLHKSENPSSNVMNPDKSKECTLEYL